MDKIVYGLRDPRNGKYYYIGMSYNGMDRPLGHLLNSSNPKIKEWVCGLRKKNVVPQIDVLERVTDNEDLLEKEAKYIKRYSQLNSDMINVVHKTKRFRTESTDRDFDNLNEALIDLPKIILRERLFRNLSQSKLAKEAGMSRSTLSLMERGASTTTDAVHKVLSALNKYHRCVEVVGKITRNSS